MKPLCKSKFIDGEQHHLYEIIEGEDLGELPWLIHEEDNQYWIPVKHMFNEKQDNGMGY